MVVEKNVVAYLSTRIQPIQSLEKDSFKLVTCLSTKAFGNDSSTATSAIDLDSAVGDVDLDYDSDRHTPLSENPNLRLEQSFLVWNVFYNVIETMNDGDDARGLSLAFSLSHTHTHTHTHKHTTCMLSRFLSLQFSISCLTIPCIQNRRLSLHLQPHSFWTACLPCFLNA